MADIVTLSPRLAAAYANVAALRSGCTGHDIMTAVEVAKIFCRRSGVSIRSNVGQGILATALRAMTRAEVARRQRSSVQKNMRAGRHGTVLGQ